MKSQNFMKSPTIILIVILIGSATSCGKDYSPEIQHIDEQTSQIREDLQALTTRLEQLEKDNQEVLDLARRTAQFVQSSQDTLAKLSGQLEEINQKVEITESVYEGEVFTYEEATPEERDFVREMAECSASFLGDIDSTILPYLIDEIEAEIWLDLESGYYRSFSEFGISMITLCDDK